LPARLHQRVHAGRDQVHALLRREPANQAEQHARAPGVQAGVDALVQAGGQLVVLGTGEPALQHALAQAAARHPAQVHLSVGFDETLAHQIEAGADAFLMPSRFEPCGLNQMYSQAYGTPPIVTPVGGLVDSVVDASHGGGGLVLREVSQAALDEGIARALALWREPGRWRAIQRAGMQRDFGWTASARAYAALYAEIAARREG